MLAACVEFLAFQSFVFEPRSHFFLLLSDTGPVEIPPALWPFFCLFYIVLGGLEMCSQTKAAALMMNIPQADIDPSGVFKYVLIRVHSREEGDDSEVDIVRGYGWAEYHGE